MPAPARNGGIGSLLAPMLLVVLGAASGAQDERSPAPRPNVLFIVIDDLNSWVGCLGGHPQTRTPNIDRLAARGTLFTNAHAPAPLCNPSRVAVLTGIAPHRSGIYENTLNFREVSPQAVTLPQRLRSLGYFALGSGKVFHYPDPESWDDTFLPMEARISPEAKGNFTIYRKMWGASVDVPGDQLVDGLVAGWIASTLARPPRQPFFLACGFQRPHVPLVAPAASFARFPLASIELPVTVPDDLDDVPAAAQQMATSHGVAPEGEAREAIQAYLACVSFIDDQVGRVLDALDASPCAGNTIVVLWSDNGFHLGEKQKWRKDTLWEESTHVPLIIVAPRAVRGARCTRAVSLQDLYPTIMELCGLPPVDGLDGQSLVPLLENADAPWDRPVLTTCGYKNHALRSERWRYIRYADGSEELYDHQVDPHEWKNLAAAPECASVKAELARWLPKVDAPDPER